MKKFLLPILVLTGFVGHSQNIEVVSNSINFPDATELTSSTAEVVVFNPGIYPIQVADIDLFDFYSTAPFTVSDTAFMVMPQDSHQVIVTFLPRHNVQHDMGLVIKTTRGFGHVAVDLHGQGKYSRAYYSITENKSGQALKTALNTRLGLGYNSLGYTTARDNMYGSVDNHGGIVECVYTGRTATFNTRAGANANSFNAEHTFPQGMFNSNEPMRSDLYHLFPTDVAANSQRGNDPFGVVSNPSWTQGGSKSGGSKFEPRDVQKGATARAMMYFVLRYQDYSGFFQSQENLLYGWHQLFPPDSLEKVRNDDIEALQNNRNPFVDYPQLKDRIPSLVSNAAAPAVKELYLSDDTIHLARLAGRYNFDFVLYNSGNTDINLSNFTLSDTSLHFDQGQPAQFLLGPHQSRTLRISFNSSKNYSNELLQFDTDVAGQATVSVPIESGIGLGIKEEVNLAWSVYPNPTDGLLRLELKGMEVERAWLTSLSGIYQQCEINSGQFDFHEKAPGLYLLSIQTKQGLVVSKKILIK